MGPHLLGEDIRAMLVMVCAVRIQELILPPASLGFGHEIHGLAFRVEGEVPSAQKGVREFSIVAGWVEPSRHHEVKDATVGAGFLDGEAAGAHVDGLALFCG